MTKFLPIIYLLLVYNISFGQQSINNKDSCGNFLYFQKSEEELHKYVDNPCSNDTLCLEEIAKAKADIANGKIAFCMEQHLGSMDLRQENELRKLCSENNIYFDFEYISDLVNAGETRGCYGLYMDKIIAEKFGSNFKTKLLKKADSLFVASNPTVYFNLCDTLPRLLDKTIPTEINAPVDKQLFEQLRPSMYGAYPVVEVEFYIDTLGVPSGYFLIQFDDYEIEENKKLKNELCKIAFDYIKQFKKWEPGIINNRKVKIEFDTMISFVKKENE